ncbi:MAG: hypothetical protein GVY24_05085 [Planctomycetes bacterium]|jgi:hypothetical protein|nr:hypothetical protein [Phycisphaerae bacterium]NBC11097.1 hypothetical protein [Planctomycetota bacterium]
MTARGFTLLELLLATMLTVIVMVGVMAVVVRIAQPLDPRDRSPGPQDQARQSPPIDRWLRVLRTDLAHAKNIQTAENKITLTGYAALSDRGRGPTHRPAKITYQLQTTNRRCWIIRRQQWLDELTSDNVQCDLIGAGVSRFKLFRYSAEGEELSGKYESMSSDASEWADDAAELGHERHGEAEERDLPHVIRHRWAYVYNEKKSRYEYQLIDLYDIDALDAHIERLAKDLKKAERADERKRALKLNSHLAFLQQKRERVLKLLAAGVLDDLLREESGAMRSEQPVAWRLRLWLDATDARQTAVPEQAMLVRQVTIQETHSP